jgi:hypothetical protein
VIYCVTPVIPEDEASRETNQLFGQEVDGAWIPNPENPGNVAAMVARDSESEAEPEWPSKDDYTCQGPSRSD